MLTGRRCGGTPAMSSPSSRMRPSLGVSKPASMRSSVVLPQPDGPSSAKNSRSKMSSDSRSTATTPPKRLLTASNRTSGRAAGSVQARIARARHAGSRVEIAPGQPAQPRQFQSDG